MIRRFLATKPKFGSSTAPPTVPVKGFLLILAGFESRNSGKIRSDPFPAKTWAIREKNGLIFVTKFSNFYFLEFPEFKTFEELHQWSLNNHEQFWARMSKSMISWDTEFSITGKFIFLPDGLDRIAPVRNLAISNQKSVNRNTFLAILHLIFFFTKE